MFQGQHMINWIKPGDPGYGRFHDLINGQPSNPFPITQWGPQDIARYRPEPMPMPWGRDIRPTPMPMPQHSFGGTLQEFIERMNQAGSGGGNTPMGMAGSRPPTPPFADILARLRRARANSFGSNGLGWS